MKEQKQYFILEDNGVELWTDSIEDENETEAIKEAASVFDRLADSEKRNFKTFLLCEGYDAGEICGGFYDDEDSQGAWIVEKEILDFLSENPALNAGFSIYKEAASPEHG